MTESESEEYNIPIGDNLKNLGVTNFTRHGDLVQIILNNDQIVYFNIHPKELLRTMDRFRESALNGIATLSKDTISKLERVLINRANGYVDYLLLDCKVNSNGNGKGKESATTDPNNESEQEDILKSIYAAVYEDKTRLYEAVIIDGIPCFASVELPTGADNKILLDKTEIKLDTEVPLIEDTVLVPLPANSYATRPYEFSSQAEFYRVVGNTKLETLDSLYEKVKSKWDLYIDISNEHNIMCSGDTIFTYFQDKLGMTHYDFFVGGNNTGKSNNLYLLNLLAYRNVLSSDMTAPNIYQLLGSDKEGVATICEDEADGIDEDREKMKIYKDGFTASKHVLRIDTSFGRKQLKLNMFCFKAYAAERLPDSSRARGFNQRCVVFSCTYGDPEYDISEVIEPGGDDTLQGLLNDLLELRNMLLIYRLLHYKDKIPDLDLNIKNREKQLFKPVFRVFQDSTIALEQLKLAINKYLIEYRKRGLNTLHAFIYRAVTELLDEQNKQLKEKCKSESNELKSTLIWNRLKNDLHGRNIPHKLMSFECEDFGTIYQGTVTKILKEVFGGEPSKDREGIKHLKFDSKNLHKLSKIYNLSTEIKVTSTSKKYIFLKRPLTEVTEVYGDAKGTSANIESREPPTNEEQTCNNSDANSVKVEDSTLENIADTDVQPYRPPQPPSPPSKDSTEIPSITVNQDKHVELPKELQNWCDGTVPSSSKVAEILGNYVAFDFEWDINTNVLEAASFVDNLGKTKVLLRSDFQGSEVDLLENININILEYDLSIGWNSTGHLNNSGSAKNSDLSILYKRCEANEIEPIISLGSKGVPYIPALKHIDLCNVYGKVMVQEGIYSNAFRTHKLDDVSKVLLGHGKYKDFSGKDFQSLNIEDQIKYSLRDSELVMELSRYNNFEVLDAMYAISEITELDFERVCRTNLSTWWGTIFDKMVETGECQPLVKTEFSGTYRGAEVLTPKKGLYHDLVVVDAKSLYPSVGINYNLSFDTINCDCCRDNPNAKIISLIPDEFTKDCKFVNPDKDWICKRNIGAFPKKLKVFKKERLRQKDLGNKSKQHALKILINGGYGVFGSGDYTYYDPRVAELVTAFGRYALSEMQDIATKDLGFEIVYGDTDSLFLNNPSKEYLSKLQELFNKELDIELEIKNSYFNCVLSESKKHYIGYGLDNKGRKVLDIVGYEGKKSDRPEFVHNVFRQLVTDVVKDNVDPIPNLRKAMSDLDSNQMNPDLLKLSKKAGENPEGYTSQTCQMAKITKALGTEKGDLVEYFDSNVKKTGSSWSVNHADIDIPKYKQKLWTAVNEVLEIAGYPVEELAKEFGVKNPKKSNGTNGHCDAEPPSGVAG